MKRAGLHHRLWVLGSALLALGCSCSTGPSHTSPDAGALAAEIYSCSAPPPYGLQSPSIRVFINRLKHNKTSFTPLTINEMNGLMTAARALNEGDIAAAIDAAGASSYRVQPLTVTGTCYWVLWPNDSRLGEHGTLIYAPQWTRDLVVEAPHVPEDHHTDREAAILFERVHAKAVIIAGAYRCATTDDSGCRPSHQCNAAGVPVQSDPSHSIRTSVHAMHLAFRNTNAVILQLHTNVPKGLYGSSGAPDAGADNDGGVPKVSRGDGGTPFKDGLELPWNGDALISNGTRHPAPGSASDRLYHALQAPDVDIRSCNDSSAPPLGDAYCGETNTQGLASNGAADACLGRATSSGAAAGGNRFIHMEQSSFRTCALDNPDHADDISPLCVDDYYVWSDRVAAALERAIPTSR